jgi:CspA family cold shock protein
VAVKPALFIQGKVGLQPIITYKFCVFDLIWGTELPNLVKHSLELIWFAEYPYVVFHHMEVKEYASSEVWTGIITRGITEMSDTGVVKWFNNVKGFGFIEPKSGDGDIFVHYSEIQSDGYKTLTRGQAVQYDVRDGPKGKQALNVVPVSEQAGLAVTE